MHKYFDGKQIWGDNTIMYAITVPMELSITISALLVDNFHIQEPTSTSNVCLIKGQNFEHVKQILNLVFWCHICQVLRFGRSHYVFLDKLKTTGVVGKDYGFMLVWRYNFFGNHLITFCLFLDEVMDLSQYC